MKKIFLISLALILTSCATYKFTPESGLETDVKDIDSKTTNVFLIGDSGKPDENGSAPKALRVMQQKFAAADKEDVLLFLGDNIYSKGFPTTDGEKADTAKKVLQLQVDIAKTFPGKVIFIPGNHDWYSGVKGLKKQEKLVEDALGKNTFLPENGCPIKKVDLSDDIVLLIVDSQWYITNWNRHPTINDECEIKSRSLFLDEFRDEIKKARGKTTLVAIHHPMYTNGPHDGQYSFVDYMKPFPVLGTLKNIIRSTSGISHADLSNQFYNELRRNLVAAAQQNDNVVFLSGHEHNLQFITSDNLTQIISGSGSKTTPLRVRNDDEFGLGANGYALLNIYKDNSSNVQFIDANSNEVVFRKTIKNASQSKSSDYPKTFKDSIVASVYKKEETKKSGFYKFLWGERYRKYFGTEVKAQTVDLDTLYGGLKPVRKGGGTQSISLRLRAPDGKEYVMRAVEKSATQYIQALLFKDNFVEGQFDDTASEKLVKDVFTGSHPYATLVISTLSDAIGVYHLNPQLFFIPKQHALGEFNDEFGDELYLFEEHASDGHTELADGKFTGDIISTLDMMQDLHSDEDVVIDQESYIRARLFDMLIGDWDRHQDQWRWMEFKEKGKKVYRPLPRDRDQAFSVMSDGFILGASVALIPTARVLRKYSPDLKDVKGVNLEPYPLDVAFLVDIDKKVWDKEVRSITEHITDSVIDVAFSKMPKEVQDEGMEKIKNTLKQRRTNLQKIADRYYKLTSKYAVLTGTNKDDYIKIEAEENGEVIVSIFRKKDGTIKDRFHYKKYSSKTTKEIWIYGLDDDDTFEVIGKSKKIKIRLIGGQNNDDYKVIEGRNVMIYDYKSKKNDLSKAKKARIKLTDDYETNVYDYKKMKANTNQIFPTIGTNPDDGLKLGLSNTYTTYGFERNPFTSQHKLKGSYYFATSGYELNYRGEFAHVINKLNFALNLNFQSPNFTQNFFGYGNETSNYDDDLEEDYNRVRIRNFSISPELIWNSKRGSTLSLGATYETIEVDKTENRFVDGNPALPDYLFGEVQFAGANTKFEFVNYDTQAYPTMGMLFNINIGFKSNLDQNNRTYGYLISKWSIAHKLIPSGKLVLATTLKGHFNFGNDYEFYQAASIGGTDGLRGYRNQRFSGKRAFYQNTDLRYSFSNLKTTLIPIKIGVYGSFDYGRVWLPNYDYSEKWHNTYGGGLFINGAELLSANLGVFSSEDGIRVAFGLGFGF
ncbi:MAG: metallophosphoesterase [Aequorivita antarctica]